MVVTDHTIPIDDKQSRHPAHLEQIHFLFVLMSDLRPQVGQPDKRNIILGPIFLETTWAVRA